MQCMRPARAAPLQASALQGSGGTSPFSPCRAAPSARSWCTARRPKIPCRPFCGPCWPSLVAYSTARGPLALLYCMCPQAARLPGVMSVHPPPPPNPCLPPTCRTAECRTGWGIDMAPARRGSIARCLKASDPPGLDSHFAGAGPDSTRRRHLRSGVWTAGEGLGIARLMRDPACPISARAKARPWTPGRRSKRERRRGGGRQMRLHGLHCVVATVKNWDGCAPARPFGFFAGRCRENQGTHGSAR